MLVLSRRVGEVVDITVGEVSVELMVVKCGDGKVRLAFDAPETATINRREVSAAIAEEAGLEQAAPAA